jgi:hypothetical protein
MRPAEMRPSAKTVFATGHVFAMDPYREVLRPPSDRSVGAESRARDMPNSQSWEPDACACVVFPVTRKACHWESVPYAPPDPVAWADGRGERRIRGVHHDGPDWLRSRCTDGVAADILAGRPRAERGSAPSEAVCRTRTDEPQGPSTARTTRFQGQTSARGPTSHVSAGVWLKGGVGGWICSRGAW